MPNTSDAPMSRPRVSVITVVFNGSDGIAKTISSTLGQDYGNMEYVVIDGGSTDGTTDIIEKYRSQIDVFVSERDAGIYDAMNKAVARATGDYLIFMNCGDLFASEGALSAAINACRADEQIIMGRWLRQNSDGHRVQCAPSLAAGLFNHQAILYSRSLHQRFGQYVTSPGLTTADYLFFTTAIASGAVPCRLIDETLAVVDTSGVSSGAQTLSQKLAIDYLFGRAGRLKLIAVLTLHPIYRRIKSAIGKA